jgi:hypothetical protein
MEKVRFVELDDMTVEEVDTMPDGVFHRILDGSSAGPNNCRFKWAK